MRNETPCTGRLHFNFCGICDRSFVSLTPSGDPPAYLLQTPKTQEEGSPGAGVGGGGVCRDTFDWWWCELNRKRWRESFYQSRNMSGLKCSCTSPLYNAAAWPRIRSRQEPRWEPLVITGPPLGQPRETLKGIGGEMGGKKVEILLRRRIYLKHIVTISNLITFFSIFSKGHNEGYFFYYASRYYLCCSWVIVQYYQAKLPVDIIACKRMTRLLSCDPAGGSPWSSFSGVRDSTPSWPHPRV